MDTDGKGHACIIIICLNLNFNHQHSLCLRMFVYVITTFFFSLFFFVQPYTKNDGTEKEKKIVLNLKFLKMKKKIFGLQ